MRGADGLDFDGFVAGHSRRLLHVAELLVGPGDAEDLVQEVLLRMYLRWARIGQNDPVGYARRSLANASTDRWRRRRVPEVLVHSVPDSAAASDQSHADDERAAMLAALAELTPRERAVVVLRYYEDLPEAQIAAELGIAAGTVKSTSSRALQKLRASSHLRTDPTPIRLPEGARHDH